MAHHRDHHCDCRRRDLDLLHYSTFETTDDAQVDGHINPISARVGGYVIKVNVNDNQYC